MAFFVSGMRDFSVALPEMIVLIKMIYYRESIEIPRQCRPSG
jgi:hypothetical protein